MGGLRLLTTSEMKSNTDLELSAEILLKNKNVMESIFGFYPGYPVLLLSVEIISINIVIINKQAFVL